MVVDGKLSITGLALTFHRKRVCRMATTSNLVQFCIIDGPSFDDLVTMLKQEYRKLRKPLYFLVKQAEYVSNPEPPRAMPRLRPIKGARRKRVEIATVESIKRLDGITYTVEFRSIASKKPVVANFIIDGRIGDMAFDGDDPAFQLFMRS